MQIYIKSEKLPNFLHTFFIKSRIKHLHLCKTHMFEYILLAHYTKKEEDIHVVHILFLMINQ